MTHQDLLSDGMIYREEMIIKSFVDSKDIKKEKWLLSKYPCTYVELQFILQINLKDTVVTIAGHMTYKYFENALQDMLLSVLNEV